MKWTKNLDASNQGNACMKIDPAGNIYLYNSQFSTTNSDIVKLDKNGKQLWTVNITNTLTGVYYMPLFIDVDSAQNVYGIATAYNSTGTQIQTPSGTFTVNGGDDYIQLIAFKLDKNGTLLWTNTVNCYNATISGITYDKYTNSVYPVVAYALELSSDVGNLVSPATSNQDLVDVAFFWSLDGSSGKNNAVKNLYVGEAGTIVPLPDRLSYYSSNQYSNGEGSYLQLDHMGNILTTKNISALQPSGYATASASAAYYYDSGVTQNESIIAFYDFRNRIRKIDMNGNTALENDFFVYDTVAQQKKQVFTLTDIKSIDDKNTVLLGMNLNTYKTYYLGDSLASNEFHFTFMDENFKVNKDIKCTSSQYIVPIGMQYSKADSTLCLLMKGNYADTVQFGATSVAHFDKPENVYTYLLKIKFDNVTLKSDQQPDITGLVSDQQASAAIINDSLATVKSVVSTATDLTSFSPVITLAPGTRFSSPLKLPADFSKPVSVMLVNDMGVTKAWQITITKTGNDNNIDTLSFNNQLSYTRDTVKKTIDVLVDWMVNTGNTSFALFNAAKYATVSPDPGSVTNFSAPQKFTVTAPDGTVADWTVNVKRQPNAANDILSLSFTGEIDSAHINDINKVVTVQPKSMQATIQSITLSPRASLLSPVSNTVDFSTTVTFNVKAENGDIASWLIQPISGPFSGIDGVVKIYPMPAANLLHITFNTAQKGLSSLDITSIYGQKIYSAPSAFNNSADANIDVSKLQNGAYILTITHEGHNYATKIIVQH